MATETWRLGAGAWGDPERWQSSMGATRGHLCSSPRRWFSSFEKGVAEKSISGVPSGPARQGPQWYVPDWGQLASWWAMKWAAADIGKPIALNAATWLSLLPERPLGISRCLKHSPSEAASCTAALHLASAGGSWMSESPGAADLLSCLRLPYLAVSSLE